MANSIMLRPTDSVERPPVKLVAHASPQVLEAQLLDQIAAAKSRDPLAPVLVVVPSRRLADHVSRRVVERFGAVLGLFVLQHRTLAARVLEHAGISVRHVLGDDLLGTLFSKVVFRAPRSELCDFVRDHPGAAAAMRQTLTDLREAGIDPADASALLSASEPETAALYARWSEALDELAGCGVVDDSALARAAVAPAVEYASRFAAIVHHGAYDLIGVHVDLLRALDRGREVTFLLPADPEARSGAFGTARAHAIAASAAPMIRPEGRIAPASVTFFNAQGSRAELRAAAYEALAAVEAGTPPHEVAIVVRSFGPYAGAMDALLDDGVALWHTSHTRPLRSDPAVAAALRAIDLGPDRGPRSFGDHAHDFETLSGDAATNGSFASVLESMRAVETILEDARKVSRREALAWLDARVDEATTVPAETGGIRILDAMQARGLTFSHVGLAGMNAGIFPRVGRVDPFLPDASRIRLRDATSRPLPIAAESDGEERLLLAMLLGSARERIHVSWRRADDEARPLVPSLALREIAQWARSGKRSRRPDRRGPRASGPPALAARGLGPITRTARPGRRDASRSAGRGRRRTGRTGGRRATPGACRRHRARRGDRDVRADGRNLRRPHRRVDVARDDGGYGTRNAGALPPSVLFPACAARRREEDARDAVRDRHRHGRLESPRGASRRSTCACETRGLSTISISAPASRVPARSSVRRGRLVPGRMTRSAPRVFRFFTASKAEPGWRRSERFSTPTSAGWTGNISFPTGSSTRSSCLSPESRSSCAHASIVSCGARSVRSSPTTRRAAS
jgi:hypothetical protein